MSYGFSRQHGALGEKVLDSRLLDIPKIQCGESRIRVSIRTNEPFGGNVYAKGFFDKDVCRVKGNGVGNSANITIPVNADCGMRRRRTISPKGLVLEMTVVLMFHPKFLTRNDKAYHIECMYMEISQKVTNRLDVSALPSTEIGERVGLADTTLPKCSYEVLNKDEKGHVISFATIGQPVYHRWVCQPRTNNKAGGGSETTYTNGNPPANGDEDERLYCLTVHSCEVDDGQGNVQKLLDSNGCPMDKTLLDAIDYKTDMEAGRKGFVFKFADRPTLFFGCQLRLELKSDWSQICKRTSDNCKAIAQSQTQLQQQRTSQTPAADKTHSDFPRPSASVTPLDQVYSTISTPTSAHARQWKPLNGKGSPSAQEIPLGSAESERSNNGGQSSSDSSSQEKDPSDENTKNNNAEGPYGESDDQAPEQTLNGDSDGLDETGEENGRDITSDSSVLSYQATTPPTLALKRRTRSSTISPRISTPIPGSRTANQNDIIPLKDFTSRHENGKEKNEELQKKYTSRLSATVHLSGNSNTADNGVKGEKRADSTVEGRTVSKIVTAAHAARTTFEKLPSYVDLDVNAPSVDVLDIPQISMIHDNPDERPKAFSARDFLEPSQQICVTRQTLSVSIFGAILVLLLIITLFCCVLFRLRHPTSSVVVIPRSVRTNNGRDARSWIHRKNNVLNAYDA
ncbi:cuticlin-1 [Ditylenchus destructor]|nr:cuticlin-1 [Ditylenchus destructor]